MEPLKKASESITLRGNKKKYFSEKVIISNSDLPYSIRKQEA